MWIWKLKNYKNENGKLNIEKFGNGKWKIAKLRNENWHIGYDIQWMNKKIELLENEYYYKTYR